MRSVLRIGLMAAALAISTASAPAQTGKTYRLGLLSAGARITDASPMAKAILGGLAKRGYAAGQNLVVESRGADAHVERLPGLVAELLATKVDVIYAMGYPAAVAAGRAANAAPVVAFATGDPVATGIASSLSHPGGNITGVSDVAALLAPKRLALLKETVPKMTRVAMLWNASDLGMEIRYKASAAFADQIGMQVMPLGVREPDDFAGAFAAMTKEPPDAILMVSDALTVLNRAAVIEFAAGHHLPAIYEFDNIVRDGGLMSYGPDFDETYEQVVALIERILKGSKPADLPFEQPTRFKLVINLKVARALGIDLPASLLARADELIE